MLTLLISPDLPLSDSGGNSKEQRFSKPTLCIVNVDLLIGFVHGIGYGRGRGDGGLSITSGRYGVKLGGQILT